LCELAIYAIHSAMPTLISRPTCCPLLALFAACALPACGLFAGDEATTTATPDKSVQETVLDRMTPLDLLDAEASYVGGSPFQIKRFNGAGAGTQASYGDPSESEEELEYGHRFHLFDKVYLRAGVDYQRFDFSLHSAPVPDSLQNLSAEFQLEYVEQGEPAIFLRTRPGVFYSDINQVHVASIDAPTDVGGIVPGTLLYSGFKKVYFLVGAHFSLLSKYPVLPIGGVVWLINDKFRLEGIPPEPRLIYTICKQLDLFAGGELLGESYKTAPNPEARPQDQRFNSAVVDFTEYRAGAGLTYSPIKQIDIDLSGGWDIQRDFDYYRGDSTKEFELRGAPYAKVRIEAEF
jgi:hypothetical protein